MTETLRRIKVRKDNRWLSVLVGGAILLVTLRPRGAWGILFALVGSELINRGLTGKSYAYTVLEFNAQQEQPSVPDARKDGHAVTQPPKDRVQFESEQSFPASDPPSFTGSSL